MKKIILASLLVVFTVSFAYSESVISAGIFVDGVNELPEGVQETGVAVDGRLSAAPSTDANPFIPFWTAASPAYPTDNASSICYLNSMALFDSALSDSELAAMGGPAAGGITSSSTPVGLWNFDSDWSATTGSDITLAGSPPSSFDTCSNLSIALIGGSDENVVKLDQQGSANITDFFKIPTAAANGGGARLNEYTLVMDIMLTDIGGAWGSFVTLLNHDSTMTENYVCWFINTNQYIDMQRRVSDNELIGTENLDVPVDTWMRLALRFEVVEKTDVTNWDLY